MKAQLDTRDVTAAWQWITRIHRVSNNLWVCGDSGEYNLFFDETMDFDVTVHWMQSFCVVGKTTILKAKCSCPHFLKHYKCNHRINLLVESGELAFATQACAVPLGEAKER